MFNIRGVVLGLLMLTSLASCRSYEYNVSEPLQPYVNEFLDVLESNSIKFKKKDFYVEFSDELIGTPFAGYAEGMFDDDVVRVQVLRSYWNSLSNKQKKILIFHELSHDMFDSLHTYKVFIMQPKMHSRFAAEYINWDWAVSELIKYIKDER